MAEGTSNLQRLIRIILSKKGKLTEFALAFACAEVSNCSIRPTLYLQRNKVINK